VNVDKLQGLLERQLEYAAYNRLENFQHEFRVLLEAAYADYPGIMFRGEG
jgi:hypothetical protein